MNTIYEDNLKRGKKYIRNETSIFFFKQEMKQVCI
jgi:hypothetical protein